MTKNNFLTKDKYIRDENRDDLVQIRPRYLDFHRLSMQGDYEYPSHIHHQYEVIWVSRGPYRASLNGEDIKLYDQQILIIKPGDKHQDHLVEGQLHYVLHFSLKNILFEELDVPSLFKEDITPSEQILLSVPEFADSFFRLMETESERTDLACSFLQDAYMETFFWSLVREIPSRHLSDSFQHHTRRQSFQAKLYKVFSLSYKSLISVDMIAEALGMSKRSLTNYCRLYLNDSPAWLYRKYVLNKGASLLSSSQLSINEISDQLGYENAFHFSRLFKQVYGVPPSHFRKKILHDKTQTRIRMPN